MPIATMSVTEFRAQLSRVLARFDRGERTPIGITVRGKTVAVVIPVELFEEFERLIAKRAKALRSAAASVRAAGLSVDADGEAIVERWAQGDLTTEQMRKSVRQLYGVQ